MLIAITCLFSYTSSDSPKPHFPRPLFSYTSPDIPSFLGPPGDPQQMTSLFFNKIRELTNNCPGFKHIPGSLGHFFTRSFVFNNIRGLIARPLSCGSPNLRTILFLRLPASVAGRDAARFTQGHNCSLGLDRRGEGRTPARLRLFTNPD